MNPKLRKRMHNTLAVLWLLSFPAIVKFGLLESIPLLVFISVYANVAGHWAAAEAAAGDLRQQGEGHRQERMEDDLEDLK